MTAKTETPAIYKHTIIVDTAEQQPFSFTNLRCEKTGGGLVVPVEYKSLGRHPHSLGDYSIDCGVSACHIERKSMDDAHGTFLGFTQDGDNPSRRERFEKELANLSEIPAGLVIVECSFDDLIRFAPETPKRSAQLNAKTLSRSIIAWMQDYSVRWLFCDGRRMAEVQEFRFLERFARKFDEEQGRVVRAEKRRAKAEKILAEI